MQRADLLARLRKLRGSTLCADTAECLAVGRKRAAIRKHFQFKTLEYSVAATRINQDVGGNAYVHLIEFERNGERACAVLKSSVKASADNLAYEYLVGRYVNKLAAQYLCFIETYGLYTFNKHSLRGVVDRTKLRLSDYVTPAKIDLKEACAHPTHSCLLIQCLQNTKSVFECMHSPAFVRDHLVGVLYQVYFALAAVADTFTHYDLHLDNILVMPLSEPVRIKYGVSFETKTLAKVIDYGRCFFNDSAGGPSKSSPKIEKSICAKCDSCGKYDGFTWLEDDGNEYHVVSTRPNRSHDLYALRKLVDEFLPTITEHNPALADLLSYLHYDDPDGTPEYLQKDCRINTVMDASAALEELMKQPRFRPRACGAVQKQNFKPQFNTRSSRASSKRASISKRASSKRASSKRASSKRASSKSRKSRVSTNSKISLP